MELYKVPLTFTSPFCSAPLEVFATCSPKLQGGRHPHPELVLIRTKTFCSFIRLTLSNKFPGYELTLVKEMQFSRLRKMLIPSYNRKLCENFPYLNVAETLTWTSGILIRKWEFTPQVGGALMKCLECMRWVKWWFWSLLFCRFNDSIKFQGSNLGKYHKNLFPCFTFFCFFGILSKSGVEIVESVLMSSLDTQSE